MIAALYVDPAGPYYGREDVEPWGLPERDAREYAGPWPVVAHPPCARWCQLASVNEARYGQKIGEDGGCFLSALEKVEHYGGVLEHPAYTLAWSRFCLPRPEQGRWTRGLFHPGWVAQVSQSAYGHRARKRTWLYWVARDPGQEPPDLDWSDPRGEAWVSQADHDRYPDVPRLGKREAKATPPAFADLLISMAKASALHPGLPQ